MIGFLFLFFSVILGFLIFLFFLVGDLFDNRKF